MITITLPWFGLRGLPGYRGHLVVRVSWPLRVQAWRAWARVCPPAPGTLAQAAQAVHRGVGR